MEDVYHYLKDQLALKEDDIVVIGCSGGPDSMALLYLLKELKKILHFSIVCCHVNHNVRKESFLEKEFLENWCKDQDLVFESMVIEHYGDDNFHNEARTIRYQYFEEIVLKYQANYLMTAHHADDLVETILMRLVRGSSLIGYAGFQQFVSRGSYSLVRPFITVTKGEIYEFNEKYQIPYVKDSSNEKEKYTRNRYRKRILPFLQEEDSNYHEKFLKFSKMLIKYNHYIDQQTMEVFHSIYQSNQQAFLISKFLEIDEVLQEKVLNSILASIYQDDLMLIHDRHIELIQKLIRSKKKNSSIFLPNRVQVVKAYDVLSFQIQTGDIASYEIELFDYATLPNGKILERVPFCSTNGNDVCRLNSQEISLPLYIRTRKYGDKMSLKGTVGHKKLKDIFIDSKIPMQERELWPVIVDATDTIVWIPGIKKSKFNKQKSENYDIIVKYY